MQKIITTIIEIPDGYISKNFHSNLLIQNNITLQIDQITLDKVKLTLNFEDTNYTQEEALYMSKDIFKLIALNLSYQNKLSVIWNGSNDCIWHENGKTSHHVTVAIGNTLTFRLERKNLTYTHTPIKDSFIGILETLNKALHYAEIGKHEREVAFWLWLTFEGLQLALDIKEPRLNKIIIMNKIATRKKLSNYRYSIGRHYRHKKELNPHQTVLSLSECIDITIQIIKFAIG